MRDMDGLNLVVLTDSKQLGENATLLCARAVVINGQEIAALSGSQFSLNAELGKPGLVQATFTVLVKSIEFKDRTEQ
jgi:hypothetical protein